MVAKLQAINLGVISLMEICCLSLKSIPRGVIDEKSSLV